MKYITLIAGARPNFMKIAPLIHEINKANATKKNIDYRLIHTGQHYDQNMSKSFFEELDIPRPDVNLSCSGGTQAQLTAKIMIEFEKELIKNHCDLVIVVGDVTSTMACAIVTKKLGIKLAHVEAGIRSNDWSMPEEINRLVTDSITNFFFTTSSTANQNLIDEGVNQKNIFFVGNTMIDTLISNQHRFYKPIFFDKIGLIEKKYFVVTLHRPANVDEENSLKETINKILLHSKDLNIIFPMHPRTRKIFSKLNFVNKKLNVVDPLPYLQFNYLVKNSFAVITDSGGITEETTVMGIPCITLRDNTERPETITDGTNELIGVDPEAIPPILNKLFKGNWKKGKIPKLWDGKTSERIINQIIKLNL